MSKIKQYKYTGKKKFEISSFNTADMGEFDCREDALEEFVSNLHEINKLQQKLYASRKEGVIFVFQAMDAAGKDGVIRTVFSTLTPHGVKEYCFKTPSAEESSHDYLWRFWQALPPRGNISIFNRSYYEDVLIGRVHSFYKNQLWPDRLANVDMIEERYNQIRNYEDYLYRTGTRVVKIFLNVSKDEQARRFLSRIDTPKKNWKVSSGDIEERKYWDEYMDAFEVMINRTSSKTSPWYVVPADHKWYCRLIVSRIVLATLKEMNPQYPVLDEAEDEKLSDIRTTLIDDLGGDYTPGSSDDEGFSIFNTTSIISEAIIKHEEQEKIDSEINKKKGKAFNNLASLIESGETIRDNVELADILFE